MKKICFRCKIEKKSQCFNKDKKAKDGLYSHCKECRKEYSKKYYNINKDKIRSYLKEYSKTEQAKQKAKDYRNKNKEKINKKNREYYSNLTDEQKKRFRVAEKKWREKNKDKINKYRREYNKKNRKKVNKLHYSSVKKRREKDSFFKLICNIRTNISSTIRRNGYSKKSKTRDMLGCSFEDFKIHIETKFQKGMSWENYGRAGWHIDHIFPVSKARDEKHLIELNHYTNLQPLWAKDNLSKKDRIDTTN